MKQNDNTNERFIEELQNAINAKSNHLSLKIKIDKVNCWETLDEGQLEYIKNEIKSLSIYTPFYNLDNLAYFESLEILNLSGIIYDFNGLIKLKLSKLNLHDSNLMYCRDIEVFFECQKETLVELSLVNCEIKNIEFVGILNGLTSLNLENINLENLDFLSNLECLERLNLFGNDSFLNSTNHIFENLKELAIDKIEFDLLAKDKTFPRLEILACKFDDIYPDLYALLKRKISLQKIFGNIDTYYQWRNELITESKVKFYPSYTLSLIEIDSYDRKVMEDVQEFNDLTNLIELKKLSDIKEYSFTS